MWATPSTTRCRTRSTGAPVWARYGGTALYLLAHVGFAWCCCRSFKTYRLGVAVVLVALVPVVANLPALGVLAALLITLNVVETIVFRAARDEARHGEHG